MTRAFWDRRQYLGGGWSAGVYAVRPGLVAKIGSLTEEEVLMQADLAKAGWALPIYEVAFGVQLPPAIHRELCLPHGIRLADRPSRLSRPCTCDAPLDMALMPRATPIAAGEYEDWTIWTFIRHLNAAVRVRYGRGWDAIPDNVARYEGRLIGLDFGYYPSLWRKSVWNGDSTSRSCCKPLASA